MDWKKARKEYLAGGISYRQLAEKYGVAESTIAKRAMKEHWSDAKKESAIKATAKAAESIAYKRAEADALVFNTAVELMAGIRASIQALSAEGPMFPKSCKDYSDAIRALQQTLDAKPTEADMEEQRARIEKLRRDAQRDDSKGAAVEVILHGGVKDYGG